MDAMDDDRESAAPPVTPPGAQPSSTPSSADGAPPPTENKPFRLGNRPALTGIRALGITAVLVFHSNFKTLPGAWAMLQVFFVLSGFLITSMLAGEQQRTGGISLRRFYGARSVRLLPPLVLTLALLALYAIPVAVYDASNRIWTDSAAALFYFADYRSALGHEPAIGYLAQCWSLAVEEQFYLIWAASLLVALKFGSRRVAYAIACTGIVLSVANRMWIVLHAQHWNSHVAARVYYAFDTRADAIFIGCLLGLLATGGHLDNWQPRAKQVLTAMAIASVSIMVWIVATIDLSQRSLPLLWLPISEIAVAVVIVYLVVHPHTLPTRLMGISVLVLVGNMSYCIYLLHWPVYVAISPFTVRWSYWVMEGARLAIIIPIALASWYLVERPLMLWRRRALEPARETATEEAPGSPVPADSQPPTPDPSVPEPVGQAVNRIAPAVE
jgi:peptidoglycan/LPS O-acetylase OafA/YrhL